MGEPPDPAWREYPKWVAGVVVASAAEERAVRAATAEAADTEAVEAERKAGQLLAEREKTTASGSNQHRQRSHDVTAPGPKPSTSGIIATHTKPARPSSPAGLRMRRMRERQRNGLRPISLDVSAVQIEALVLAGFLDASMRDDAAEVARGVRRLLDRHAARNSVTPVQAPAGCS